MVCVVGVCDAAPRRERRGRKARDAEVELRAGTGPHQHYYESPRGTSASVSADLFRVRVRVCVRVCSNVCSCVCPDGCNRNTGIFFVVVFFSTA